MTSCWAAVPRVGHIGQPGGPWLEKAFPGRRHNQLKEIQTSRKGIRRGHRHAPSPVLASADTDSGDQRLVLGLVWPRDGWANCKAAICMSAERSRGVLPSVTGDWMEMPAWSTALHMAAKGGLQEAEGLGISWRWVGREDSCGCGEPGDRPSCTVCRVRMAYWCHRQCFPWPFLPSPFRGLCLSFLSCSPASLGSESRCLRWMGVPGSARAMLWTSA